MKKNLLLLLLLFLIFKLSAQNEGYRVYSSEAIKLAPLDHNIYANINIIGPDEITKGENIFTIEISNSEESLVPNFFLSSFDCSVSSDRGDIECNDYEIYFKRLNETEFRLLEHDSDPSNVDLYMNIASRVIYSAAKLTANAFGVGWAITGAELTESFFNWLNTENENWPKLWGEIYYTDTYSLTTPTSTNYNEYTDVEAVRFVVPIQVLDENAYIHFDINNLTASLLSSKDEQYKLYEPEEFRLNGIGISESPEPIVIDETEKTYYQITNNFYSGELDENIKFKSESFILNENGNNYYNIILSVSDIDGYQNLTYAHLYNIDLKLYTPKGEVLVSGLPQYSCSDSRNFEYITLKEEAAIEFFSSAALAVAASAIPNKVTDFTKVDWGIEFLNLYQDLNEMVTTYDEAINIAWGIENLFDTYPLPSFNPDTYFAPEEYSKEINIKIPIDAFVSYPHIMYQVNLTVKENFSEGVSQTPTFNLITPYKKPEITLASPVENQIIDGEFLGSYTITSDSQLDFIKIYLGDELIFEKTDNLSFDDSDSFTLNSINYPNGAYTLKIQASDINGSVAEKTVPITINNENNYQNDYAALLQTSKTNPVAGEDITLSATIQNTGSSDATENATLILYDNDVQIDSYSGFSGLAAGNEDTYDFTWKATPGMHAFKVEVQLPGDENPDNDVSDAVGVYVGEEGNLLVDGEQNPVKNLSLSPGKSGVFTLQLYNKGSRDITVYPAPSSNSSSLGVFLEDGPIVQIQAGEIVEYQYEIGCYNSANPGDTYIGSIKFAYDDKEAVVTFNVQVVEYTPGYYEDNIASGSILIDGGSSSTRSSILYMPNETFYIDGDPSSSYPEILTLHTVKLDQDDINHLVEARWGFESLESVGSSTAHPVRFGMGTLISKSYTWHTYDEDYDFTRRLKNTTNKINLWLNSPNENEKWKLVKPKIRYYFCEAAWGKQWGLDDGDLDDWDDGDGDPEITFSVDNVYIKGNLDLYNNRKKIKSVAINGTGNYKFDISRNDLYEDNYFVIQGD
jgi:hypothetical protein